MKGTRPFILHMGDEMKHASNGKVIMSILLGLSLWMAEVFSSVAAITINRVYHTNNSYAAYNSCLRYRMNCYGFAIQVYSLETDPDTIVNGNYVYKQIPGEFAVDNQTFSAMKAERLLNYATLTNSQMLDYFENKITADFASLYSLTGSEWTISATTATAAVPSGKRKIAIAYKPGQDFHFYMRNSDGTWSHKPGVLLASTTSFTSNTTITDGNIQSVISENGFTGGSRYYLIGKSSIIDYPHYYGHGSSTSTAPHFSDRSGIGMVTSSQLVGTTFSGLIDYEDDEDYFWFNATLTTAVTISVSSASFDMDVWVYNTNGGLMASDSAYGDASVVVNVTAGGRYFVRVREGDGEMYAPYTITITY